ncbi:MAG: hypothetical protein IJX17_06895 [Clostridia bacterium]|nr:hypothetical protein [Clostridia bacterium]
MARKNNLVRKISVLGLAAALAFTGMTLTGCSKAMQEAQENIDYSVTTVLNEDASIQERYDNAIFSDFTFLGADVAKENNNKYNIDINGVVNVTKENTESAYTTLNYLVDGKYFDEMDKATHENIINTLATIVQNEKFQSVSVEKVGNVQALNESMSKVIESPLDGFRMNKNFLYGVGNVSFDEETKVASFSTKDASKFSKTTTTTTYGYMGTDAKGNPKYGLITRTKTDYETFFINHNVYVQLTPEEFEAAKNDHSIIFSKFNEYVKNEAKDKYVIQETNISNEQEYSANMRDNISLSELGQ